MSKGNDNLVARTKEDVAIFRAVVGAGLTPSLPVIHGLWRWFTNVDLALPLPIMELAGEEKKTLVLSILDDLDSALDKYEIRNVKTPVELRHELNTSIEAENVDNMWRELAGVYASILNEEIMVISEEDKAEFASKILEQMSESLGMDLDGLKKEIRENPSMRLSLRMMGLNPDELG